MSAPVASIIIPVWNRADLTRQCLDALGDTVAPDVCELIAIDNHSTDETPALLAAHPLSPAVIRNDANLGFARACNQGAAAARGEFLLFLNNDTVPTPGWLEPMIEILRGDPGVAIVGSRLLYPDSRLIQHAGVAFDAPVPFHLWCLFPADWPQANVQCDVGAVTAACMLVRRSVFHELGGFDERYLNGFEDVDFCLRVVEKGHRIVYCPRSVVLHHESMSEGRSQHDGRNFALFRDRWGERLRERRTSRRDLVVAAFDEVFRINEAGTRFVGRIDRRLFRYDVWPPTVKTHRHRAVVRLATLWFRLRFFFHWRKARRIKASLA
jgi:GT2 family glycosyltransferase